MFYSAKTKQKFENILKAFESYIDSQNNFDIVFSKKIGYMRIYTKYPEDLGLRRLHTPEAMLDALFNEIVSDVVYSPENLKKEHDDCDLTEYEKNESRRRIAAILETMEDGEYLSFLDEYMRKQS